MLKRALIPALCAALLTSAGALAQDLAVLGPKPFISYFRPTPVTGALSASAWGAATVGARDPDNGL